jgi:ribose transport system ATP-binding protein
MSGKAKPGPNGKRTAVTLSQVALEVRDVTKRYGSTVALNGVSVTAAAGDVHALLGENGAGKSTLVRILSGLTQPDSGEIAIFQQATRICGPRDARAAGIRTAFQEISLVRDLTVTQNFLLMEEPYGVFGLVASRRNEAFVKSELERLGLGAINPRAVVQALDLPTRQKIEIARCVSRNPRLLLLDEPTASLSLNDVHWLAGLIDSLKANGTTIIFISHRMQEVREFCRSMTVFRNGKTVLSVEVDKVSDDEVIEIMIGRSLEVVFPAKRPAPDTTGVNAALSALNISSGTALKDLSFDLWPGQILGVAGLQGMGQRELFLSLFGAARVTSGEIIANGTPVNLHSPADAIAAGVGISLVPEDRKKEGLFLQLSGKDNLSLPSLERFVTHGLVNWRKETHSVMAALKRVQIPPRALTEMAEQFSGGNQQKMIIAKWLMTGSRILLLYDPTRGVDIGTKSEIYKLIDEFAAMGGAVLFYSTDIAELVSMCVEVMVVYRGRVSDVLAGDQVNEANILRSALGQSAKVGPT